MNTRCKSVVNSWDVILPNRLVQKGWLQSSVAEGWLLMTVATHQTLEFFVISVKPQGIGTSLNS
ncbi:hypothetical protein Mapa_001529 [Marchantia paleacea]|nr:hypothetical protein Mapa_001529 [Marchantia paleacea]